MAGVLEYGTSYPDETFLQVNLNRLIDEYRNVFLKSRKGIEDTLISTVPQIVNFLSGFITTVLLARGLGAPGMGKYALILSVSSMVTMLSDLGIGQTAIRFAARCITNEDLEGHRAVLRWAFRLRILLALATSVVTFVLSPALSERIWHDESLSPLIRLSLLIGIFGTMASVPTIYFQSLKRFRTNALVAAGQGMMLLIGALGLAVFRAWTLEWVIVITLTANAINAIAFLLLVPKDIIFKISDAKLFRERWVFYFKSPKFKNYSIPTTDDSTATVFALFMVASSVIVMTIVKADIWLMGFFLEPKQIGVYTVASRFTLPMAMLLGAMNTALWPRAAALSNVQEAKELLRSIFRLSSLVAAGGLVYSFTAPLLTPLVFGPEYAGGIILGQLLCLRFCVSILISPVGVVGYSFGLVRYYWAINAVQLAAVVGINIWLLPVIGPMGSAIALIANEVIASLLTLSVLRSKMKNRSMTGVS